MSPLKTNIVTICTDCKHNIGSCVLGHEQIDNNTKTLGFCHDKNTDKIVVTCIVTDVTLEEIPELYKKLENNFDEVIFTTFNENGMSSKDLNDLAKIPNISVESFFEHVDTWQQVNILVPAAKGHVVYVCQKTNIRKLNLPLFLGRKLVAIYDENNNSTFVTNKACFVELQGNTEDISFIGKIKTIETWENVCLTFDQTESQ